MPIPRAPQPSVIDRLQAQLLTSGLSKENSALFQVIKQLIDFVKTSTDAINKKLSSGGTTSATFTPVLTNQTNLTASTAYLNQYSRVGNIVTVSGRVDVDPTAAGLTQLKMTLPLASHLANAEDCAGVAFASGIAGQGAAIHGDNVTFQAVMEWIAVDVTNQPMWFVYQYRIML